MRVDFVYVDETMQDGEYGQAGSRVYVELGGDITAIGGHRIDRNEKLFGYLFVLHSAGHATQYVFFSLRQTVSK